ncbi:ABC transporter permease [Elioraea rosea]|uniref:ABC transporter permease n=1 Tax=Elioraea rosea TaxID=2492390 RepID=UPI001183CF25|nr:ABC transporter permease [Elioraea rosea]
MSWFLKRIGLSILLVWIVASIVFLAIHFVPGDPAELLLSTSGFAPDPVAVEELRRRLGLDQPVLVQYVNDFQRLLSGDLGRSMKDDSPIIDAIARRLPRTLELIVAAGLMGILIGVPAGTYAAIRRGGLFDRVASALSALGLAVPVFVMGTLIVLLFAQTLRWVPAGGYVAFDRDPWQHLTMLAMPALTIGLHLAPVVFRVTRAAVLDVTSRDYVRTARAKGVGPPRVLVHHVVRNALMPVVTVVGLQLGGLLGGTVLVEFVFNWPGLSGLLVESVSSRDYPEVVAIVLTISILFVGLNLVIDLLYGALDPRVRRR